MPTDTTTCKPAACPAKQLRTTAAALLARLDAVLRDPDLNSALSIAQCHGFPVQQLTLWGEQAKAVKEQLDAWEQREAESAAEAAKGDPAEPANPSERPIFPV